ncbi:ABC transporter permease [Aliikangiella sp. IMCC44359]|uniref:ABC transporter permease n=1 Tax=Aliikangiella sp. IMCC44359 TaxID=3459125 RepID=UPI00403AF907
MRTKTHLLLMVILCILLLGTAFIHWQQKEILSEAQDHWQTTNDLLWANQPARHPHRVAHYGHVVIRPLAPLSFIEPGVTPYVGHYLFLEAHRQNSSSVQSSAINPINLKFAFPSVSTLMLVFWPLLLIVLGYSAFSNEWDTGRLYWLSSLGTSVWHLFLGKLGVLAIYAAILLCAVGVTSITFLGINNNLSYSLLIDVTLILLVFAVYTVFWLSLIFGLSFYSKNSQQSLWRLLTIWILLVVVLPKISVGLAQAVYPTPDRANFDAAVEKAVKAVGDSHNPDDPYFSEFKNRTLVQYGVDRVEDLPINWKGLVSAEGERITSQIFQEHYKNIMTQFAHQDRLRLWFGMLSPLITAQHITQKIAHTDRDSADHFEQAAENFRYDLIQRLNHLHSHQIKRKKDGNQKIPAKVWQDMALFNYDYPVNYKIHGIVVLSLLLWSSLVIAIVYRFRQQEVTR